MENKVFYIVLLIFVLINACWVKAQVLRSDLTLMKGLPPLQAEEYIDPYWDLAWHGKVASYGDPDSQFLVAEIYEQGKLVPKNKEKALEYYKKAAEQGHIESCMRLAKIYGNRNDRLFNLSESKKWYQIAAEKGYVQSQIRLSHLLEEQKEYESSFFWMERAMRQMFPDELDLIRVSPDLERLSKLKGDHND